MHNTAARSAAVRRHKPGSRQRVKPISLHFSLFVFIFFYAFVGGLIFTKIETNAAVKREAELQIQQHECVIQVSALCNRDLEEIFRNFQPTIRI